MPVTNIAQGANKQIAILGIKEMQGRIKTIVDAAAGDEISRVMGDAAEVIRDRAESNARAVNLPKLAMRDFYTYERQPMSGLKRNSVTALAGLRKRGRKGAAGYVTWRASKQASVGRDKTNRAKRSRDKFKLNVGGTLIGENLATMWEFGTSKMSARPFFRPAITSARGEVLSRIAAGYRALLERLSA